jgi:hypothetical protein
LVVIWLPVFTSDFKKLWIISKELFLGAYILFAIIASFCVCYKNIIVPIYSFFRNKKNKVSSDPENMSKYILERCNKK